MSKTHQIPPRGHSSPAHTLTVAGHVARLARIINGSYGTRSIKGSGAATLGAAKGGGVMGPHYRYERGRRGRHCSWLASGLPANGRAWVSHLQCCCETLTIAAPYCRRSPRPLVNAMLRMPRSGPLPVPIGPPGCTQSLLPIRQAS